jgi:hypothetical protein
MPVLTNETVSQRGEEIYHSQILPLLETKHQGQVIVIDVQTGDFVFQGADVLEPGRILRQKNPQAVLYARRVGFATVTKMGGSWNRYETLSHNTPK